MALWRHSGGAWYDDLFLTAASYVKCWADVAKHMSRLWQAGDAEHFERRISSYPDSKVHGANIGPTWGPWDPDGPHVGPMNLTIRVAIGRITL